MIKQKNTKKKNIKVIETSLTLAYRKNKWGLERIILDGVANHLPRDTKGKNIYVKFKQNGNYVDLKEFDSKKPVEEIVFEDDGKGYDARLLGVLFSTKTADEISTGQFGEGLKLVAAAALRGNHNIKYHSRNWIAKPFTKKLNIDGNNLEKLCFNVTFNGQKLDGSRTVFYNPSEELIEETLKLPDNVLDLNDDYTVLFDEKNIGKSPFEKIFHLSHGYHRPNLSRDNIRRPRYHRPNMSLGHVDDVENNNRNRFPNSSKYNSRIIDLGKGKKKALFVKGFKVPKEIHSIFSYDLGLEDIAPDRFDVNNGALLGKLRYLLEDCEDKKIIKKVLKEANKNPCENYEEFQAFAIEGSDLRIRKMAHKLMDNSLKEYCIKQFPRDSWKKYFYELYGEKAVIASSNINNVDKDVEYLGYRPVKLNKNIADFLKSLGVKSVYDIANKQEYKWVDLEDLTNHEKAAIGRLRELDGFLLGGKEPPKIRVYSGVFLESGKEIECTNGIYVKKDDYIGLKRSVLNGDQIEADEIYIHEAGHCVTGKGDYTREHTDYFVKKMSMLLRGLVNSCNKKDVSSRPKYDGRPKPRKKMNARGGRVNGIENLEEGK